MTIPKKTLLILVGAILFPVTALAITDSYEEWIIWTGGAGPKPMVNCGSEYFAHAIGNYDHSRNTVSQYMKCGRVDDYFPAGTDIDHSSCGDVNVIWTAGAGDKPWARCPSGKYAVGFAIYDYGGRNEGPYKMRCCGIEGLQTWNESTYDTTVYWWGGSGFKGYTTCDPGSLITGIRIKDYGQNNQAVSQVACSFPDF